MSANGPPSWPEKILSNALVCPSDTLSSMTIAICQFPFDTSSGKCTLRPTLVPERSMSSRLPSRTLNTPAPQQFVVPSGLSGGALAEEHGQTLVHEHAVTYRPFRLQAIGPPSRRRP